MNAIAQFVRTTIVGGLLFLAPIVVLIVILAKAFDYAKKGLNAVLVHILAASDLSAGLRRAVGRARCACLLSCGACRPHRDRARVVMIGVVGPSKIPAYNYLQQESGSRRASPRSRSAPWSSCPWKAMAARRSIRSAERRPRLDLYPSRRTGIPGRSFSFRRTTFDLPALGCSRAQLSQAMRRALGARRWLADQGIAPPEVVHRRVDNRCCGSRCSARSRSADRLRNGRLRVGFGGV